MNLSRIRHACLLLAACHLACFTIPAKAQVELPTNSSNLAATSAPLPAQPANGAAAGPAPQLAPSVLITSVVVNGADSSKLDALGGAQPVSRETILSSAGTFGDFSRYLQVLPGVVWNSDLSNEVLVHGGHPVENLFVVDGIEIPNINHFALSGSNGGFTSMIDSSTIGSMDLKSGAYDSGYSSRLSSLINIHTRDLGERPQAGNLSVGIAGAGGFYQRTLANRGSLLLAAHRSILNLVTNDIGINGVPTYTNGMSVLEWKASERDHLSLLSLTGADTIEMDPCALDTYSANHDQTGYDGWRTTQGLTWRHDFSSRTTSSLSVTNTLSSRAIDQQLQQGWAKQDGHSTCQAASLLTVYKENSRDGLAGANYELRRDAHGWLFSMGASAKLTSLNDAVAQPVAENSPLSATPDSLLPTAFQAHFRTGQSAGFFQAEGGFGTRWRMLAGLRAETFAITGDYALDPRLSVAYRINNRQMIHGSLAMSSQLPPALNLLSFPENRGLRPVQDKQAALGLRLWQNNWMTIDAESYLKHYDREAVSTQYPSLALSNMIDTLGQSFLWLPLTSAGTGNARGTSLAVNAHWTSRIQIFSSATWARSWYRALDGVQRRGNYDLPVVLNGTANLRLFGGLQLDLRDTYTTGRPYTPFNLLASNAQKRGIYDLTQVNALRGPVYNRLDLEMQRRFQLPKGALDFHGGAENIADRTNLLGYVWLPYMSARNGGNSAKAVATVPQIGLYPIFMARYEF